MIDVIRTTGILISAILIVWFVDYILRRINHRITTEGTTTAVTNSLVRPIEILILCESIILALTSISSLDSWRPWLDKANIGIVIVVASYGFARIVGSLLDWQLSKIRETSKKPVDLSVVMLLRRIAQATIYAIGLLVLLDHFGFSIGPLAASLGIGGVAFALALQPTLGNFFAGTQVISDRVARVGDFIEIDDNTHGYVTDIGWRSTKIRSPDNNIVVIPNSLLANSKVINFNLPSTALVVSITYSMSYDSDLNRVKEVALEVANDIVATMDEAVSTFEPWVGFENFGDSGIVLRIAVQAKDRLSSLNLKSELIVRLHRRFQRENITASYPVTTTYLKQPTESTKDNVKKENVLGP